MFRSDRPRRRRAYFIHKKQQIRFAAMLALHALLFPILFLILTAVPPFSNWFVEEEAQVVFRKFLALSIQYWWVWLITIGLIGYVSVSFSHQIFGPISRLEGALRQKRDNPKETVECTVRRTDYFHEFSKLLEDVLNRL